MVYLPDPSRYRLSPRELFHGSDSYGLSIIKTAVICVGCFIFFIIFIRLFFYFRNYHRQEQAEMAWWQRWHWNQQQEHARRQDELRRQQTHAIAFEAAYDEYSTAATSGIKNIYNSTATATAAGAAGESYVFGGKCA
ncbi:hypothetical protein ABW20_dc0107911 [Dactylellina cionopaga]|nr:hypothetical protein ABW20_dc0107911 [Dactylellina cionopaga]